MTLADEQQPAPHQQSSDTAQQREGRSGRRRRRGKRPSDAPGREDGQQGRAERPEAPARQAEAPGTRDGVESRAVAPAPSGGGPDSSSAESGAGRNRRRNRNRGRGEGRDGQAPREAAQGASQGAPQAPAQGGQSQDRPRQQPRPGQPRSGGQPQRADQPKGEKKERPSRGSILNRRQTRGEFNDAPKPKEEAPQYVPVSAATVEQYVNGHRGWQKEVLTTLRNIVRMVAPEAEESIMWSQPVFSANGPVCFFKAYKDYITFGFWRGTELSDPDGLLSGDLTMMRSMTLRSAKDVRREAFEALVKQAVRLNREKGDPTLS
ncbi:MAG: hypothetical protein RIR53_1319 [Bacteroidota bacterium]